MKRLRYFLLLFPLLFTSCITEEVAPDTIPGNFYALWKIVDQRYCFFQEKADEYGLDWREKFEQHRLNLTAGMTNEQLFEVCGNLLAELRDGHVNLYAAHDVARYWKWFEDYPANFSDSLQRRYLGTDYRIASGIKYKILDDNIGYIYCGSFESEAGSGNLSEIFRYLAPCNGVIVDVRNNSGGMLTAAEKLASCFTNKEITVGYMSHKTGPGHDAFSAPQAIKMKPAEGMRWQKDVVVLTNRSSYSAANSFVMYMKACPNVTTVGDRTGGGAGMPFLSELPNGWTVRFSACPMYDTQMVCTESGIDPDVKVDISSADYNAGRDTILEEARRLLHKRID